LIVVVYFINMNSFLVLDCCSILSNWDVHWPIWLESGCVTFLTTFVCLISRFTNPWHPISQGILRYLILIAPNYPLQIKMQFLSLGEICLIHQIMLMKNLRLLFYLVMIFYPYYATFLNFGLCMISLESGLKIKT